MRALGRWPVVKSPYVAISQKRVLEMTMEMRSNLRKRRICLTVGYKGGLEILCWASGIEAPRPLPPAPLSRGDAFTDKEHDTHIPSNRRFRFLRAASDL